MTATPSRARPIGWPLLPIPDDFGCLSFPSLEDSVRQMIKLILRTRPGELLMHPGFGAGLEDIVHRPNSLETRRNIHDLVASSVARWESRVLLDRVEVSEMPNDPAQVRVEIVYRLRRTGAAQQLGLSLILGA